MCGAGERSRFVAEQFAFQQVSRHGRAVHFQKCAMCARRKLVDQARENFFAGAAFAEHKHRNVDVGDQRSLRTDLAHRGAGGDEEYVVAQFFDFAGVRLLILAETLIDDGVEFCLLKGLGEVILRAEAHGLHDLAGIAHAGEHDDFHAGLHLAQLLEGLAGRRCRA